MSGVALFWWCKIQGRVAFEKPDRLEHESGVFDRHHGEVFRTRQVHHTDGVPQDHIRIDEGPVGLNPFREPRATFVLVHVCPGSV